MGQTGDPSTGERQYRLAGGKASRRVADEGAIRRADGRHRRHVRAVEILEAIATDEAWGLIELWSRAAPGSVLTEEAGKSLSRRR